MKTENTMTMVLAAAVGALCSYCAQLVVPLAVLVAVMRFQLANSLAADGIVGRDTWHKLLGV